MVPRSNNIAALPSAPPRRDGVVLLLHPLSFHAHTPLLQSQLSLQVLTAPTPPPTPVPGLSGVAFVAANLCWLLAAIYTPHAPSISPPLKHSCSSAAAVASHFTSIQASRRSSPSFYIRFGLARLARGEISSRSGSHCCCAATASPAARKNARGMREGRKERKQQPHE
jgi:hypothetical protein